MLCSTNAINPKLQNISAAAALKLQNALHVQQFQHFQEAPALGSSFTCMLEKRPRILNAHHISKADPSAVQALGLATSLAEEIWPQQLCLPAIFLHGLATSLPIPLSIPSMSYVCR